MPAVAISWERVPAVVRALLDRLTASGHEAVLVGGCVRDLARGVAVRDWDVASSADLAALLALFPSAVPIGARFGTVMVPTPAGPVDVTRYRGEAGTLAADLARRDFTLNAAALRPGDEEPFDPFGGLADLAASRLAAVGDARARLAEDPLRALRAARLVAELDLRVDPALEAALPGAAGGLARVAAERVRSELERMLVAPRAGRGLALLRSSGLEAVLAPGAAPDAAARVDALPAERTVRLAAWLRGTTAARILAAWRMPVARAREVEALLALHPVDETVRPREPAVRRLLQRAGETGTERLFALREAELATGAAPPEAAARLAALRETLAAVRRHGALALARTDLALDGRAVMATLGRGPGPWVGRALHYLTECVLDDPDCNTPEALRERLAAWAASQPELARGEPARHRGVPRP